MTGYVNDFRTAALARTLAGCQAAYDRQLPPDDSDFEELDSARLTVLEELKVEGIIEMKEGYCDEWN